VIGAGPAGLSAARTAAGLGLKTLVLERMDRAGELDHPCGAAIAPVPGVISGWQGNGGVQFPTLHLTIPPVFVIGTPTTIRYVGPNGGEFRAIFPNRRNFPVAVIDKPALLRCLADQAATVGAELRFSTPVMGLCKHGRRITGVKTRRQEIGARIVISAEGISRRRCEEAGLYNASPPPSHHVFVISQTLCAPAAGAGDVGQINTFGRRYTSIATALGTVDVPKAGRAAAFLSVITEQPRLQTDASLWTYLEEYKERDPRVRNLFAGSKVLERSGCRMSVRDAPRSVVRDGFMGVGDAVTPGGHVGILPAIYLGQRAAETAADGIRAGDVSAGRLAPYDDLFHGPILRGLETEGRILLGLADMTDEELDRVCETLNGLNLAPFLLGRPWAMMCESFKWLVKDLPLIVRDRQLLRRMMSGGTGF
jgi:flavin-dependent dehydrogenase